MVFGQFVRFLYDGASVAWRSARARRATGGRRHARERHVAAAAVAPRSLRPSCREREAWYVRQGVLRCAVSPGLCKRSQCIGFC